MRNVVLVALGLLCGLLIAATPAERTMTARELTNAVRVLEGRVDGLDKTVGDLNRALQAAPKGVARDATKAKQIIDSINAGTLCLGMTLEEADRALRKHDADLRRALIDQNPMGDVYQWSIDLPGPERERGRYRWDREYRATFIKGALADWSRH